MKQRLDRANLFLEKNQFLFQWLRWFYPQAHGIRLVYLLYFFFPQKIFRINGDIRWPVHFTSRILYPENLTVGNRSAPGMNAGCYVQARNGIFIGNNLRMGPGVGLISSNHEEDDYDRWTHDPPIRIGNNVWIGMNAVVLPASRIGDNVVIGANAVVRDEIPSNVVAAGSPCRVLRPKAPYQGRDYGQTELAQGPEQKR